jgi:hypothetical protein
MGKVANSRIAPFIAELIIGATKLRGISKTDV